MKYAVGPCNKETYPFCKHSFRGHSGYHCDACGQVYILDWRLRETNPELYYGFHANIGHPHCQFMPSQCEVCDEQLPEFYTRLRVYDDVQLRVCIRCLKDISYKTSGNVQTVLKITREFWPLLIAFFVLILSILVRLSS